MSLKSLQDLYVEELKDIYSAEKQILQALPKWRRRRRTRSCSSRSRTTSK